MTSKSILPTFELVKDGKPDRYWVKCQNCFWDHEMTSERTARIKAFAHVSTHNDHAVELHFIKTEVIRHGKEKDGI